MLRLFDNRKQPYISWKGTSTNSAVPVLSRPLLPNDTTKSRTDFRAGPIKHWRKQLIPTEGSGHGKTAIGMPSDLPGGLTNVGVDTTPCVTCGYKLKNLLFAETVNVFGTGVKQLNEDGDGVICNACNPENNIIKSARTNLRKRYYSDTKGYLKSRCLTYEQRLSGDRVEGNVYITPEDTPAWPSDSPLGSQVRTIINCHTLCPPTSPQLPARPLTTIYKPNNVQYATQGAVSSSSRLTRLKLNTINDNGSSFRTAFGNQAANAGKYHGTSTAPYFIKSKINICDPSLYHRTGNKTTC